MPSIAAITFEDTIFRGRTLASLASDLRLRPSSRDKKRVFLHAALASYVAAWESYIENLVAEFFSETIDPQLPKFSAIHSILRERMLAEAKFFNTPNAENSRDFIVQYTGYDPIGDWVWPARGMGGPQLRLRLNEILKVRHSFAHGITMPTFSWNVSPSGEVRLTGKILMDIDAFFLNIVKRTDGGMKRHLVASYNSGISW